MLKNQMSVLEKLLSIKVAEDRIKEYENFKKIEATADSELSSLEKKYDIELPEDFKEFYTK